MYTVRTSKAIILRYVVSSVCNSQNINMQLYFLLILHVWILSIYTCRTHARQIRKWRALPSALGDDHFVGMLFKLGPQLPVFQSHAHGAVTVPGVSPASFGS